MGQLGVVEKVIELIPSSDAELINIAFGLLFNLAFDPALRSRMVSAGLTNYVAAHIDSKRISLILNLFVSDNEIALGLLYQLSVVDDAKAMFTFTDSISMVSNTTHSLKPTFS
jgi:hypothetical protein